MNIKRALRIAKEQPWFKSFEEHVISERGNFESYVKLASKNNYTPNSFIRGAFSWSKTKEGLEYWKNICKDFDKKYQDKSVKIFVKEAYAKVPVAKLINANASEGPRFISVLKDTGISFDYVESEGQDLIAYKSLYKIEEEWI